MHVDWTYIDHKGLINCDFKIDQKQAPLALQGSVLSCCAHQTPDIDWHLAIGPFLLLLIDCEASCMQQQWTQMVVDMKRREGRTTETTREYWMVVL